MGAASPSITLTSTSMKWALGGWSFFIAENYILSENRSYLIDHLGDEMYHIAYGSASSVAMGSILYGYLNKVRNAQPLLWPLASAAPISAKILSLVCLSLGLGMLGQLPPKVQIPLQFVSARDEDENLTCSSNSSSSSNHDIIENSRESLPRTKIDDNTAGSGGGVWKVRCPFDFTDNRKKLFATNSQHPHHHHDEVQQQLYGIERITRHPGLWSFGLIGLGHGFLVPSLPQKAFLYMPTMVAFIGGSHSDSRHRRGLGGSLDSDYDDVTSNIPFLAILTGKQGNNVTSVLNEFWRNEVKHSNAMLAVGVSAVWVLNKGRGLPLKLLSR